ncbi:MAG: alginate lyase family protein [Prevotellaceae bacterium]|jgi:GH18 family chitinase|nr:alginate lyase family protein [Prevotellaceae bacterium]
MAINVTTSCGRFLLPLCAFLSFCGAGKSSAQPAAANSKKIVVAYVTSWSSVTPDPNYVTHVNYAFGHVNSTFDGVRIDNPNRLRALSLLKRDFPHLKVLLSVGGWGSGRFSEMAAGDSLRARFSADCRRVIDEFGLDGIDIDWEYPTHPGGGISHSPDDAQNYTRLMRDLRAAIGNGSLLTLASSAGAGYIDFAAIEPCVDFVNIMTYDMGKAPKYHAAMYRSKMTGWKSCSESVTAHREAGLPSSKLVMGVPFYGRACGDLPDFIDYSKIITLDGYTAMWDDTAKCPYLVNKNGDVVCSFDNPQSIAIKCQYVVAENLYGVMYWDYAGDDSLGTLRKSVYSGLNPTHTNALWMWDVNQLRAIKALLQTPAYSAAYQALLQQAERALQQKISSVTDKKKPPPSGDKHDYVSLSRYWWPNPQTADGLPYINKDGQSNPELNQYDRNRLGSMCAAVNTLALAYFYSNDERYAKKAGDILSAWFIAPDTRMNPHLEYAQLIPGRDDSKGRPEGGIDSYSFVEMLNSVELLSGSPHFSGEDRQKLQAWFKDLAHWRQTSSLGRQSDAAKNNHGTSSDAQVAAFLYFAGDTQGALSIIDEFPQKRIFKQIEPDGKQPLELQRTLAYHYSAYNLSHMFDLLVLAKKLGRDTWRAVSPDGRSFYNAVDYLSSFLGKDASEWPYRQISGWSEKQQDVCNLLYRIGSFDPSRQADLELYRQYSKSKADSRLLLLYGNLLN